MQENPIDDRKDEDLVADYLAGDQEALGMLFQRYKNKLLNFSLRMLGNRADAEDVTGEVFLSLFSGKYTYRPEAKFSTWLFTVTRNQCISRYRKNKPLRSLWFPNRSTDQFDQWEIEDTDSNASTLLEQKESQRKVRQSIASLPQEQKEAILLREYDRFSYEQIAAIMQCSLEKVKVLIFRAREGLREELASYIREGENE